MNYNALYLFALSILLNACGLITGRALFGKRAKCARIVCGVFCVLLALPPPAIMSVGAGFLPTVFTILLCYGLVVSTGTRRNGNRSYYIILSSVLLFIWLSISEQALLPLLYRLLPWQWEFILSLAGEGLVLGTCCALFSWKRAWVVRRLEDSHKRFYDLLLIGISAVALYAYETWVLDKTGFYRSLGDFTGYISHQSGKAHYVIAITGGSVIVGLMAFVIFVLNRIEKINRTSAETSALKTRNEALMESYIAVQKYYHDMKHHFETVQYLAENNECEKITAYMNDLMNRRGGLFQAVNSGNAFVDAVLNSKIRDAENAGIHVAVDVVYPQASRIAPVDICSLLANLLDNAIENCPATPDNRYIKISINSRNCYLVVKISNMVAVNPLESNPFLQTGKSNKELHGLGLQNVRSVLKTYDGEISYRYDKPYFVVIVTLVFD